MKRVMVFGTFDLLHQGHIKFLEQAKEKGDKLYVVIGRDSNVFMAKSRNPVHEAEKRKKAVESLGIAEKVILGEKDDFFLPIRALKPQMICLGYDQDDKGLMKYIKDNRLDIAVKRLKPYKENILKSSLLRKTLI